MAGFFFFGWERSPFFFLGGGRVDDLELDKRDRAYLEKRDGYSLEYVDLSGLLFSGN